MNGTRIVGSLTVAALLAGASTAGLLALQQDPQPSSTDREQRHEEAHEKWVDAMVLSLCMQGCHFEQLLSVRR